MDEHATYRQDHVKLIYGMDTREAIESGSHKLLTENPVAMLSKGIVCLPVCPESSIPF